MLVSLTDTPRGGRLFLVDNKPFMLAKPIDNFLIPIANEGMLKQFTYPLEYLLISDYQPRLDLRLLTGGPPPQTQSGLIVVAAAG